MNTDDDLQEPLIRVVCAAIRHQPTGLVICGARHYDGIMRQAIKTIIELESTSSRMLYAGLYSCEQGFLTNKGEFLTREQAWVIAEAAGQIRNRKAGPDGVLYSESLY